MKNQEAGKSVHPTLFLLSIIYDTHFLFRTQ